MLRSSRDLDSNAPTGDEYITIRSSNYSGTDYDPKLTVVLSADYAVMATNETDGDDGICYKQDADFNTAWTAVSGTAYTAVSITTGFNLVAANHRIDRGFVLLNTADLPDDLNLTRYNVTLLVYVSQISNDVDFEVYVQNGQPTYPHVPIQASDYDKSNYLGGLSGGNLNNTTTLSAGNWYPIPLNDTSWISLTGDTNLTLRSDRDVYGIDFNEDSWLTIIGDEYPYHAPRLMLEYSYTAPAGPGPGANNTTTPDQETFGVWWDTGCITGAIIIMVVIVIIAMFYNRS